MTCPCGSQIPFDGCCGPCLEGRETPATAAALMRSRYTAYARQDIAYLAKTHAPETRADFDPEAAKAWAAEARWLGLKILSTEKGGPTDPEGVVEFVASYDARGQTLAHRERSRFRKSEAGGWLFVSGDTHSSSIGASPRRSPPPAAVATLGAPKVGRNDPCPCGSGKKFKKCCGA